MNQNEQDAELRKYAAKYLSDGVIDNDEIVSLYKWLTGIKEKTTVSSDLLLLISSICADKVVTSEERRKLLEALKHICNQASSKEKGDAFETYVIRRFDKSKYKLIEWRSDKKIEDWGWPLSSQWPDLVMEQIGTRKRFAVECKYKGRFCDGARWAEDYQIKNYRAYETQEGIPVFVALGFGGCASLPDRLFIARLNKLKTSTISTTYLREFEIQGNVPGLEFE